MSRFRVLVFVLAGAFILTLGLLLTLLYQPSVTTVAAQRLLQNLRQELQADVRVGRVTLAPLQGRITLDDVGLFTPDTRAMPLFEAKRLQLQLSRSALLRREIRLTSVEVVSPAARGRHLGAGRYNWDALLPSEKKATEPSTPLHLALDRLIVRNGRITYEDPDRRIQAEVGPISADMWLDTKREAAGGSLTAHAGWLALEKQTWPLDRAHLRFSKAGARTILREFELKPQGIVLTARGDVTAQGPSPILQLEGQVHTALTQLPAWREWRALSPEGQLTADWALQGTADKPTLGLNLRGHALQAGLARVKSAHVMARLTPENVRMERLKLELADGQLFLQGNLPLEPAQNGRLSLRVSNLSLPPLLKAAKMSAPPGFKSKVNVTFAMSGQGTRPEDWQGKGAFSILGRLQTGSTNSPYELRSGVLVKGRRLQLDTVQARALGGLLTARFNAYMPAAGPPSIEAEGRLRGFEVAQLSPFVAGTLPVTGTLGGQFRLKGHNTPESWGGAGNLRFRGAITPETLGSRDAAPFELSTGWRLQNHVLRISSSDSSVLGGKLGFNARVPLKNPVDGAQGNVHLRQLSLAVVSRLFANVMPPVDGTLNLAAAIRNRRVSLRQLDARVFNGRLTTRGEATLVTPARYQFETRIERWGLSSLQKTFNPQGLPLTGEMNATLQVAGRGRDFRLRGPLSVSGQADMPHPDIPGAIVKLPLVGSARLDATPSVLQVPSLNLQMAELNAQAAGTYHAKGHSNLRFSLQADQLNRVGRILGIAQLRGDRLRAKGILQGPAAALQMKASLFAGEVAYGPTSLRDLSGSLSGLIADQVSLKGRLAGRRADAGGVSIESWLLPFAYEASSQRPTEGRLRLPSFFVQLAKGRLAGQLNYALRSRRVDLTVDSHDLTVGALLPASATTTLAPDTAVSLHVQARGPVAELAGDLTVALAGFQHQGHTFGPSKVSIRSRNNRAELTGRLFGDQALLSGHLATRRGDAKVRLRAPGFRLAPLLAAVPKAWRGDIELPTDGLIAGEVSLQGNLHRPKTARGIIQMSRFSLEYPELMVRNEGPWHLSLSEQGLTFDRFKIRGATTQVDLRGTLGIGSDSDLNLEGALDLRTLEKIAPAQLAGASGRLKLDGTLRGRWDDGSLTGALNIRDGELETRNLPQPVRDLNVTLRMTPSQVFLDSLQASFGQTGRLQATGGARLSKAGTPVAANMQLDAQEVALRVPGLEAVANAELSYVWKPGKGSLDGQIRVLEGAYTEDIDLTRKLTARRVARSSSAAALANPFVKDTALRVQVALPDQFFVRNNVAKGELRGDVLVLGTPTNPALVGRVEARDTEVNFQDRVYTLDAATVDFIDPHRLVPYVNISARSTIQAVDVRVQANGTPDKLRLELTSTPAMSQTDILTLIATGKTSRELGDSGSGGLATASNFLLDQVAGGVARGITDQGVVDVLKVKPGSVDPASPGGASFTVGKRINEKLTITYTQDITAPAGQTPGRIMIFDYLLTDAIVLKLEQDLGGGFNASARYRLPIR